MPRQSILNPNMKNLCNHSTEKHTLTSLGYFTHPALWRTLWKKDVRNFEFKQSKPLLITFSKVGFNMEFISWKKPRCLYWDTMGPTVSNVLFTSSHYFWLCDCFTPLYIGCPNLYCITIYKVINTIIRWYLFSPPPTWNLTSCTWCFRHQQKELGSCDLNVRSPTSGLFTFKFLH